MKKIFLLSIIFSLFSLVNGGVLAASLQISTGSLPEGMFNVLYDQQIQAQGGIPPYAFSIKSGALPSGLSLSDKGKITGTPTKGGAGKESNFSIRVVDNSSQVADKNLSIFIGFTKVTITSPANDTVASGTLGESYPGFTFEATGGIPPYVWENPKLTGSSLLADFGLSLSSADGKISGVPIKSGNFQFAVRVKGDPVIGSPLNGALGTFNISIKWVPFEITTANLSSGELNKIYSAGLSAHGGLSPYSWSMAVGSLPNGLNLSSEGVISGTSVKEGNFLFTVLAKDAEGTELAKSFSILIEKSCQCSDGTSCGACKAGSSLYCDGTTKTLISNPTCVTTPTPGPAPGPGGSPITKTKLEVNWPNSPMGTPLTIDSKLTDLIKYFYEWGISLGGFAAFIALIIAGFQYLTSVGNAGKMSDAMSRIRSAGLGLVLLFSSFLILNTINPQLTELKIPTMELGKRAEDLKSISIETTKKETKCIGATIWSGAYYNGTPEKISLGENPFSPKKDIGSVQMKGACQLTLFKIAGSCNATNDANPSVAVLGDTPIVESGTTKFSCAILNHSSFIIPTPAP